MKPIIGSIYQHYRTGGQYKIVVIGISESDLSEYVVYEYIGEGHGSDGKDHFPLGTVWIRAFDSFMEDVSVDGILISRFSLISNGT